MTKISVAEARKAAEMMLIVSGYLILPVVEWDGKPVGDGKVAYYQEWWFVLFGINMIWTKSYECFQKSLYASCRKARSCGTGVTWSPEGRYVRISI